MFKFIVRALAHSDIVNLMVNTSEALRKEIKWDCDSLQKYNMAPIDEHTLVCATALRDWKTLDDYIFGPEVPTGGLVVVTDGKSDPTYGFVCGNEGWFMVRLPEELRFAIGCQFLPEPPKEILIEEDEEITKEAFDSGDEDEDDERTPVMEDQWLDSFWEGRLGGEW